MKPAAKSKTPARKPAASSAPAREDTAMRAPDATRHAILDIAETLFAENGIAATSLRSILLAAGANIAAAHYHFGSKEALVEEVIKRRAEGLVRTRDNQLTVALQVIDPPARLRAILKAFFEPGFFGGGESREIAYRFAQVRSHLSIEKNQQSKRIFGKYFGRHNLRFINALVQTCPHISKIQVYWRFHLMLAAINYSLLNPSRVKDLTNGACDPSDTEEAVKQMVEIFAAAFNLPASRPAAPVTTKTSTRRNTAKG